MVELNKHTKYNHTEVLETHETSSPETIPQLDGSDSPPPLLISLLTAQGSTGAPPAIVPQPTRAPFTLNREKQLSRLQQDANLSDLTVTVSPNSQSVVIQCSTGSYTHVAVPALRDLKVGSEFKINSDDGDITAFCFDVAGQVDNTNAEVKAVVFIRLLTPNKKTAPN